MQLIGCLMAAILGVPAQSEESRPGDYVVLLHGLGRTPLSMKRMEWALSRAGFRVINIHYPSRSYSIAALAEDYVRPQMSELLRDRSATVHFVTHSMGGIVLRAYLSKHELENPGRVVMLAPPNQGSELADGMKKNWFSRKILGPAIMDLGTGMSELPRTLGPTRLETGIIAGDKCLNPFLSCALPKPNDGKVSVENARLEGVRDFLVVHKSHTWMMWDAAVIRQTRVFLRTGRFEREPIFGTARKAMSGSR